jgi:two-component system, sensor histidine kinase and response regulator
MAAGDGSIPVNLGATLRWVAGDETLLRELVAIFLEDAPKHLRDLRTALDRRDVREVERIAHGLKGVVANFGAEPARSVAADLEEVARTRRLPEAGPLIGRLDVEVGRIVVFFSDPDWRARIGG